MAIRKPIVEVSGSLSELPAGDTLPLFTTSTAGNVPASGGGTTNFLRADGTWSAPSGGGGSSVTSGSAIIDFGMFPGSNEATVNVTGQSGVLNTHIPRVWVFGDDSVTPAGDPYYNNTRLLMHCNGSNGSTTFTDNSFVGSTLGIVAGTPTISTTQSLFGGASLFMTGNDVVSVPYASGVNSLGTTFSIEFAIYLDSTKATQNILDARAAPGASDWVIYAQDAGGGLYNLKIYDGSATYTWGTGVAYNTWQRFGLYANTGTARMFTNGALDGAPFNTSLDGSTTSDLWIGGVETIATYAMRGYLDEIRITGGQCRYTANYVLDTAEFADFLGSLTGHTATDHRNLQSFSQCTFNAGTPVTGIGFPIYGNSPNKMQGAFKLRWAYP
jgi:Concanavalin A-like lectin/glucanases superfamily